MLKNYTELYLIAFGILPLVLIIIGCQSPAMYRQDADSEVYDIISEKQRNAVGRDDPLDIIRPSDILRRQLLISQNLPYTGNASLGADQLDLIPHWPEKTYPQTKPAKNRILPDSSDNMIRISLIQSLMIGAQNSSEFQNRKENVFQEALDLTLERDEFGFALSGQVEALIQSDRSGSRTLEGSRYSGSVGIEKKFKQGIDISTSLAIDIVNLLTAGGGTSRGIVGDASISIPLLRGSGEHIVTEPLTQAERNVIYAIYELERFKQTFAVNIARSYLDVLNQKNQVDNAEENYRIQIVISQRQRRLADAGRTAEIEVDRAVQSELNAKNRWILAEERYNNRLDEFKSLIGLSPDASLELIGEELEWLSERLDRIVSSSDPYPLNSKPDSRGNKLKTNEVYAIKTGLKNRVDLIVSLGKVVDAQRAVVLAADALGAELTLLGSARIGEARTIAGAGLDDAEFRTDKGIYSALLTLDLPFERTAERNVYRNSYILLERAVREVQELEDVIKLSIRSNLRALEEASEAIRIQKKAVKIAEKRVKSTGLFLESGRAELRDLLEAQEDLLSAKNSLTSAVVNYRVAELELQRDTGLLRIDPSGIWEEYTSLLDTSSETR